MATLLEKCKPRMAEIEEQFDKDDASVVALYEEAKEIARANNMLSKENIHSKYMYVDTMNRYEDGVVPSDVTDLISKIYNNGFRNEHLLMPTCADCPPPNTPAFAAIKRFNDKMVEDSAGQLPAYEDDGKYVSFTCGHTSQGLRCIWHGSPIPETDPKRFATFSQDGKFSLSRLREAQPLYAVAASEGIAWDVFKWQFIDAFPFVPSLAQEAGNAGHGTAKAESRLEVMLKIAGSAKKRKEKDPNNKIPWPNVQREAIRGSGLAYKHEIPDLCTYVCELSGGVENPWALYELRDFCRHLKNVNVVRGNVAAALATVKIGEEGSAPLFRLACMKAMSSASDKYSKGGDQQLLKTSDITSLQDKKKALIVLQGEAALVKVREVACTLGLSPETAAWSTTIGLSDVRVVHFVFNKPDESRGIGHAFIGNIGYECWQALCTATGKTCPCPFQMKRSDTDAAPSDQKPDTTVKKYNQQGTWTNQVEVLNGKGFKVGVTVYNRQEGEASLYVIQEFSGQQVKLKKGNVARTISAQEFMENKYAVYDVKKEVIDQFDTISPMKSMDYSWGVEEARAKVALDEVHSQHVACLKHITAIHSPIKYRAVSVKKAFPKDAIGLVPLTTTISIKKAADEIQHGNVCLRKFTDPATNTEYNVVLMSAGGLKLKREEGGTGIGGLRRTPDQFGVPFWLITVAAEKETPNMAMKLVTATNGIKVPILKNTVDLKSGDKLCVSQDTVVTLAKRVAVPTAAHSEPKRKAARKA